MFCRWVIFPAVAICCCLLSPCLPSPSVCFGQTSDTETLEDAGDTDSAKSADDEPSTLQKEASLKSARQTLQSFIVAVENEDYRTAALALDFSAVDPTPDPFEQVKYAQRLKACLDNLALVDFSMINDEADSLPVSFPPDKADSPIVLERCEDGLWRFAADTVAKIDVIYTVLREQTPIDSDATTAQQPVQDESVGEPTSGDEPDKKTGEARSQTVSPPVPDGLKSARSTMRTLFDSLKERDYQSAVAALDFSEFDRTNPGPNPYRKIGLARNLKEVIERLALIDYAQISDDPKGPILRFPLNKPNQPVEIVRNEEGAWRFSVDTVSQIDALHEIYKDKPILNLPDEEKPWLSRELVLGNETWRILWLFAAIFVSLIIGHALRAGLNWRAGELARRGRNLRSVGAKTVAKAAVSVFFLVGLSVGLSVLVLDHETQSLVSSVIHVIFAVVIGYTCFRLVDVVTELIRERGERSGSTLNHMLAPIVSTSLRLTIIVLVLLEIAMAISDQPPSTVLAGLGAGGLAVGLAAQETIKNLFGSVMIFTDRPFELGDRIVFNGHDGPVESVGFRSTRIRTLEGHLVTVPNGEMANTAIQNIGKRPYIRRKMNIRIAYDTPPELVRKSLEILRELLADHEGMHEDLPPRVFLDDFLDTAMNICAIYWFHPPEYWDYCVFGEKLNLQVIEGFHAAGISFALPAHRLFLEEKVNENRKSDEPGTE